VPETSVMLPLLRAAAMPTPGGTSSPSTCSTLQIETLLSVCQQEPHVLTLRVQHAPQ
jgi:hypothetical protein